MFSKLLTFITCLFITCAPESSEAGKFIEIPDQKQEVYVEPKAYKETGKNPYSCVEKHYKQTINWTGTEAKKAYKAYGECLLAIHNEQAMPKDIACQQKDGFHNYKLQFKRDFSNENYFAETAVSSFYKISNKLYYHIQKAHFEAWWGNIEYFEYSCDTRKSKSLAILQHPYYSNVNSRTKINNLLIFGIQLDQKYNNLWYNIATYDGSKVSTLNLITYEDLNSNEIIVSNFSWSEIIKEKIVQYINDYGVGKYMEKYSTRSGKGDNEADPRIYFNRFAEFDLKHIKKNLVWKLIVTMPWFQAIFNIDLKNKKIWR